MERPTAPIDVLHVDDDEDFVRVSAELLEAQRERLSVETASTTATALDRIGGDEFDCIVSDYEMPERDGIEFLEAVRAEHPDLPFVLFTGKGSEEVASEAISAGVTEYLQKQGGVDQYTILANRIENAVDRQRSKARRKRAERRFEAIFDDPETLLSIVDPEGRVREVNETTMEYVEEDREDVIGEPFWETPWWADVDFEDAQALMKRLSNGEYADFEIERSPPGRERFVLSGSVRPATDESGNVVAFVASARDVTEQRERQRELRRYERMVDTMLEAACIYDEDGRFSLVNEYLADFYGTTREQLEGNESNLIPKVQASHEGDPVEELLAGEREAVEGEVEGMFPGHGYEVLEYQLTPFRFDGEIEGVVGVSHEITELKERERRLEQQNERLDEFASIVAHDLRNPLNVATGRVELAHDECNSEHLSNAADALDRIEALIDDLLTLAREGEPVGETDPVALPSVLEETWRSVATQDTELVVETDATIQADRGRLEQLFANLFGNAVEHAGPAVTVTVGRLEDGFYVADDGPGIPEEDRETVFEAGYSTSEDGTGFGLSIVEEIAEAHGWDIGLSDSEAGGARFEITGVEYVQGE